MRKVHTLPKGVQLQSRHRAVFDSPVLQFDAKCAMKTRTRKIGTDAVDFMTVIGAGRFTNFAISPTRRI